MQFPYISYTILENHRHQTPPSTKHLPQRRGHDRQENHRAPPILLQTSTEDAAGIALQMEPLRRRLAGLAISIVNAF